MKARGHSETGEEDNRGNHGLPIVGPLYPPVNPMGCVLAATSPAERGSTFDALPNLDAQFRQHVGQYRAFLR